jgi:hypothetical protein
MAAEKTVSVSFRVSPEFKALLEAAAQAERRSQTNMLETLLLEYCRKHGIQVAIKGDKKTVEGVPVDRVSQQSH